MTKAQEVYERVEALVASGTRKADAFRQLGEELGQESGSLRSAYYTHTRTLGGSTPRARATHDPVEAAVIVLQKAIAGIDAEVQAAKNRADEAIAAHKQLRETAEAREKALQAKIDALKA